MYLCGTQKYEQQNKDLFHANDIYMIHLVEC